MGRTLIVIGLVIAVLSWAPLILFLAFFNDDPSVNPVGHGVLAWLGTPVGLIIAGIGAAVALIRGERRRPST